MTDLRKAASGRRCMIRIPGYCNHDPATTVLAHWRITGISGIGMKAPDLLGAWACSMCHAVCDFRMDVVLERGEIELMFLEGVMRTQYALIREGVLKW